MSQHQTIISAVKTMIETLTGEPTVEIRADLTLLEGDIKGTAKGKPLIILAMGGERPANAGTEFEGREYETFCAIHYVQNFLIRTGTIDDAKGWRDTIRKLLVPDRTVASGSILTGVSAVWDCNAVDLPVQDRSLTAAGWEVALLGLVHSTCEVSHVGV